MSAAESTVFRVALLGNPNTGKTTLFNALCGLRHKTSNFPGTTQEARLGFLKNADADTVEIIDLPGVYSLELPHSESEICRSVLAGTLAPPDCPAVAPDAVCVVVDATNLSRNLTLVGEATRRRLPMVVVLNMMDLATRRGATIDSAALSKRLGCEVVECCAKRADSVAKVREALTRCKIPSETPPGTQDGLERWADEVFVEATAARRPEPAMPQRSMTDRIDRVVTDPVVGVVAFVVVMTGLFWSIFTAAQIPMGLIEALFGSLAAWVEASMPEGILRDFIAGGVLGGVGGTIVFLPQICLLFFLISLLEDTGYLARAAFVMDRVLRPFGLPGHAFVPLLSSHACALPGIMAARAIPDRSDRLATILVSPFTSCSARIPVYVLLTGLLFPESPLLQSVAFTGCYALGLAAAMLSALVARRTILRGKTRPMALELPTYKWPSLRTAGLTTYDRALVFLKKAGTNILAICIVLWWLSAFPKVDAPAEATQLRQQAEATTDEAARVELEARAEHLENAHAAANSYAADLGRFVEPVFRPMDYDWRLCVGVVTSFAAREVFVSTMAVVVAGETDPDAEGVTEAVAGATRDDGVSPVFTKPVSWSLLAYYVLAMQCLPTLAVTAREAGGMKWALLQLVWMCGLAYLAAWLVFVVVS